MSKKMNATTKIQLGFGLSIGALVLLGLGAYLGMSELVRDTRLVVEERFVSNDAVMSMNLAQGDAQRALNALNIRRFGPAERRDFEAQAEAALAALEAGADEWKRIPHTQGGIERFAKVSELVGRWRRTFTEAIELHREKSRLLETGVDPGDPRVAALDQRGFELLTETRAEYKPSDAALGELDDYVGEVVSRDGAAAVTFGSRASLVLLGAILALAVTLGLVSWRIARELRGTFSVIGENLDRLAQGDMPPRLEEDRGGEFNRVRDSLNSVTASIGGLIDGMARMSAEHEKGDIDVQVDALRFQGAYRAVAEGVNGMVGAHLAVNRRAIGVFADFGKGNFEAAIEQLPGKKRFVNDAIEQVRGNLKGLIAAMNRMSAEHDRGEIDAAIDTVPFQGDFAVMARGVNQMVGAHVAESKKAMEVFGELGRGNFSVSLAPLPGKKRMVNDAVDGVKANLAALVEDAASLSRAAVEGRVGVRADVTRQPGDFRKIVQGVNETLDALNAPMKELASVLERLAKGELSARTEPGRYQNESRKLVEGVNVALGALLAPADEAARTLARLADRDLRARMSGDYAGDHARLKTAVNATAEALDSALAQVAVAAEQVSSASTQIAATAQAVATGASEQASSLEETSSSIDSVSALTRQSADSAQQANALAQAARAAATEGAAAVEQMNGAMGRIRAASEGTSQIIKDVSDIAFQTNLLALNAAVEAARAGEAGRGFAVVAEEVRSLALRAKEAATKTEELIKESVKLSGEGEVTSRHVGTKLGEIVAGIGKVSDIVSEISTAAKEQASGIDQVTKAVAEMDKVTQGNAASAEESSSSASELSGQAEELAAMVSGFKLSAMNESGAAPPRLALVGARKPLAAPARPSGRKPGAKGTNGHASFPMDDAEVRDF